MRPLSTTLLFEIVLAIVLAARPMAAAAQEFGFDPPPSATDAALPAALRDLAERIVPVYKDDDSTRYLANLAALQMTAGDPQAAHETRIALDKRLQSKEGRSATGRAIVYAVYVQARTTEAQEHVSFASAYKQAFRATFDPLDDLAAYDLEGSFLAPTEPLRETVQHGLDQQRDKHEIALEPALDLVRAWAAFEAYRSIEGLVRPLFAAENERRYVVDEQVSIPVADDATVAATLVRPRAATESGKVATLLEFTLDRSSRDARESAAHGYASVLALARIAGDPAVRPRAPFESDGDDARAVIDWIAKQPWSDGRVGMQGTGYGGFVAWSVAKRLPPALKAIATSDPMAPGIDVPMRGRIVLSSAYRWVYEMLSPPGDDPTKDATHWRSFDEDWYRSGASYRDFATLPGPGSVVFRRWLNHPSYDRFWQKWLPFGPEFAKLDIPVLTITGYYSAGQTAALYYFTEHHKQAPNAEHALLIGPFDEQSVENGATEAPIRGSTPDTVARIDPNVARYAWFAHALDGADRPELLSDNVNYELPGANEWRHGASLGALEQKRTRYYLEAAPGGTANTLAAKKRRTPTSLTATLSLRDRRDADWRPSREIVLDVLPARDGTALFMTEPFSAPVDVAGRLSGVLDFTVNKQDVDLVMMLYELRSTGEYVKLFDPAYAFRASYAKDRVHRHLLVAGVRQQLPFQSEKMIGRQLQAGSRLVLALGINKRADQQLNYGTGKDVSEEAIADGRAPVRIRWHDGSFIEIPSP
jgi:putative CocE/NonD family hydrolase